MMMSEKRKITRSCSRAPLLSHSAPECRPARMRLLRPHTPATEKSLLLQQLAGHTLACGARERREPVRGASGARSRSRMTRRCGCSKPPWKSPLSLFCTPNKVNTGGNDSEGDDAAESERGRWLT